MASQSGSGLPFKVKAKWTQKQISHQQEFWVCQPHPSALAKLLQPDYNRR
jgi:hypothetical protein